MATKKQGDFCLAALIIILVVILLALKECGII